MSRTIRRDGPSCPATSTPNDPRMRHPLTKAQVAVLRPKYVAKREAEALWIEALTLLGLEGQDITGGDLDAEEPYLLTAEESVSVGADG